MFDKARTKAPFHKITPHWPPLPAPLPVLPLSLFRALFRGEPILIHSLAVIFSFVNPSFWPGIMQQNIKATLILKRCQTSLPSCNAPFPSHSFHFFGQLKNQRMGRMLPGFSPSLQTTCRRWQSLTRGQGVHVLEQCGEIPQSQQPVY